MSRRLLVSMLFCCAAASAQQTRDPNGDVFLGGPKYKKDKKPTSKSVKGTVTDDAGKPIPHALVTLTNEASGEKLTFITRTDGRYHFDDLSFSIDYELQAQSNGLHSDEKKLSQYDHTPEMVRILELHR